MTTLCLLPAYSTPPSALSSSAASRAPLTSAVAIHGALVTGALTTIGTVAPLLSPAPPPPHAADGSARAAASRQAAVGRRRLTFGAAPCRLPARTSPRQDMRAAPRDRGARCRRRRSRGRDLRPARLPGPRPGRPASCRARRAARHARVLRATAAPLPA